MKYQNVMVADEPRYLKNGKLDIESVELKVVDFGIFGSNAGFRMENVNCGSVKYMAPELLKGDMRSTPKIDVWALGLMLHGFVFGFLPFSHHDVQKLKEMIKEDELDYKKIKRLKPNTIKDELRLEMNKLLRKTSNELIDLILQMLDKDPEQRLGVIEIYDHPWMQRYRAKLDNWSDSENENEIKQSSDSSTSWSQNSIGNHEEDDDIPNLK